MVLKTFWLLFLKNHLAGDGESKEIQPEYTAFAVPPRAKDEELRGKAGMGNSSAETCEIVANFLFRQVN